MALTNFPTAPTVSGVYQIRDSVPELNEATKSNTAALQNAFKFGTKVHDYKLQRDQEKVLRKENERQTRLKENIANDKVLLAKMKKELAELKADNDAELRQGTDLLQQNNVPVMQSYLDTLNKTDENKSFWNFKTAEE